MQPTGNQQPTKTVADYSVDALQRELRRFRDTLPQWVDAITRQEACGESAGGCVRAYCTAFGDVTRLEIAAYFTRTRNASGVDAAILEALQRAQTEAERRVTENQENLQFLGLPIGEVMTGKVSLLDFLGTPSGAAPTEEVSRQDRGKSNG